MRRAAPPAARVEAVRRAYVPAARAVQEVFVWLGVHRGFPGSAPSRGGSSVAVAVPLSRVRGVPASPARERFACSWGGRTGDQLSHPLFAFVSRPLPCVAARAFASHKKVTGGGGKGTSVGEQSVHPAQHGSTRGWTPRRWRMALEWLQVAALPVFLHQPRNTP